MFRNAIFLVMVFVAPLSSFAYQGDGTAYSAPYDKDATGFNACQFGQLEDRWERMYGAMNSAQYDGSCGRCVRVRGIEAGASGQSYLVKIVDKCPTCSFGDVDFSTEALQLITGFSWDRKRIEWEWADCSGDSSTSGSETSDAQTKSTDNSSSDESGDSSDNTDSNDSSDNTDNTDSTDDADNTDNNDNTDDSSSDSGDDSGSSGSSDQPEFDGTPQPIGTFTNWVFDCKQRRSRCWDLALASQGYQCMNKARTACCLEPNGKKCKKAGSAGDEEVQWDGYVPDKPSNSRRMLRL